MHRPRKKKNVGMIQNYIINHYVVQSWCHRIIAYISGIRNITYSTVVFNRSVLFWERVEIFRIERGWVIQGFPFHHNYDYTETWRKPVLFSTITALLHFPTPHRHGLRWTGFWFLSRHNMCLLLGGEYIMCKRSAFFTTKHIYVICF